MDFLDRETILIELHKLRQQNIDEGIGYQLNVGINQAIKLIAEMPPVKFTGNLGRIITGEYRPRINQEIEEYEKNARFERQLIGEINKLNADIEKVENGKLPMGEEYKAELVAKRKMYEDQLKAMHDIS